MNNNEVDNPASFDVSEGQICLSNRHLSKLNTNINQDNDGLIKLEIQLSSANLRSTEELVRPDTPLGCKINHDKNYELFAFVGSNEEYKKLYYDQPQINADILYNYTPVNYNVADRQGHVLNSSNVEDSGIERSTATKTNKNIAVNDVYQRWNDMWSGNLRTTISYSSHSNNDSNVSSLTSDKTAVLTDIQDWWVNLWTTGQTYIYKNTQEQQQQQSIVTTTSVSKSYRQCSSLFSQPNCDTDKPSSSTQLHIIGTNRPTKNNIVPFPLLFNQEHNTNAINYEEEGYLGSSILSSSSSPITYNNEKKCGNDDKHSVDIGDNNNNVTKCLSDSMAFNADSVPHSIPLKKFAIAMISNVPWNVSIKDVAHLFSLSSQNADHQCVHIIIDKNSGKTQKDAFVEFDSEEELVTSFKKLKNSPTLKGRKVIVTRSSTEKLFRNIFPSWKGVFVNDIPSIIDHNYSGDYDRYNINTNSMEDVNHGQRRKAIPGIVPPLLVKGFEYDSLLNICRNYKLRYSRKCPERPFENFISMMVKFPWDTPDIITTIQRDHLYEYYKLATGTLRYHLNKPYHQFEDTLMVRMVRAALICPGLTVNQKKGIITASGMSCPEGLIHYLEPALEDKNDYSPEEKKSSATPE